jgi:hypothetical protein
VDKAKSEEKERVQGNVKNQAESQQEVAWKRKRQDDNKELQKPWSELNEAAEKKLKEQFRRLAETADAAKKAIEETRTRLAEQQQKASEELKAGQQKQAEEAKSLGHDREKEVREAHKAEREKLENTQAEQPCSVSRTTGKHRLMNR